MRKRNVGLAAGVLCLVLGAGSCRTHGEHGISLGDQTSYINNSGGPQRISLPDGSHVTIKSGTKIILAHGFGKDSRDLDLDGEGMFEVQGMALGAAGTATATDAVRAMPMVVHTRNLVIEVLDTLMQGVGTFRVDAIRRRPGEEVDLLEGRLRVAKSYHSDTDNEPEVLVAGEMVMINREIDLMEKEKLSADEMEKLKRGF